MKSRQSSRRGASLADKNPAHDAATTRSLTLVLLYTLFMLTIFAGWMHLPGTNLAPIWALAPIFVMSFRDARLMPSALLFVVGLLTDIVVGTPLGAHAFSFLGVAIVARLQQRYLSMQGFVAIWADFAALSIAATLLVALTTIAVQEKDAAFLSITTASLMSWVVLFLAFPVLSLVSHALLNLVHKSER